MRLIVKHSGFFFPNFEKDFGEKMNAKQNTIALTCGDFCMRDWLLKSDLSTGAKLTYSVLACCAGGKDHAWPSQQFLADQVSATIRSVQKYLEELVDRGFIKKTRTEFRGKIRCIYHFLLPAVLKGKQNGETLRSSSDAAFKAENKITSHDVKKSAKKFVAGSVEDEIRPGEMTGENFSPLVEEPEKILPEPAKNLRVEGENISCSYNKVESSKLINIPPSPPPEIQLKTNDQLAAFSGKGGDFYLEPEDSNWSQVKASLACQLTPQNFQTWIAPLLYDFADGSATLRGPNDFFNSWVVKNFKPALTAAFEKIGITDWKIELQTENQRAALEKAERLKKAEEVMVSAIASATPAVDALSLEEQFEKIYQTYDRPGNRLEAFKVFKQLAKALILPEFSIILKAIKRFKDNDSCWHRDERRYVPHLHKWLMKQRWND